MAGIIIIGSGMAGLACARRLKAAGLDALILDKGRGIGGRIATRRHPGMQFDHGAQFVTAQGAGFAALLQALGPAVGAWDDGMGRLSRVGQPGMSALPAAMAEGLTIRQGVQVTRLTRGAGAWALETTAGPFAAERVVVTLPAPQVAGILGADHPLVEAVAEVRLAPCLTLMAAIAAPPPFVSARAPDEALSWIALDSAKPGRPSGPLWVAQADERFSRAHLEDPPEALVARMLPMLCARLGVDPARVIHAEVHRWRYARVTQALGRPFLEREGLFLGGDWCIGPRVEAAWTSGTAMAEAILAQ